MIGAQSKDGPNQYARSGRFFRGEIAELTIYNGLLSDAAAAQRLTELAVRYGITIPDANYAHHPTCATQLAKSGSGQCTSSRSDGFCAKTCGVCTGSGCVDVQPGTSSYTQHANKNCHSSSGISTWSDGSDAGYSTTGRTVDECKAICATYHDTCAGFTFVRSTGTCEWKSAVSLVANALQLNGVPLTPDRPDTVGTAYSDDGNGVLETSSSAVHNAWSARGAALVLYAPMPAEPWAAAVRVRMSSGAHQALRHGLEKSGCQRSPPACLWRRIRGAGCQGLGSRLPRRA